MPELDSLIVHFDRALRTVAGVHGGGRASPGAAIAEGELEADARANAAALMRVNHVGEVCAQALYQGQGLTARNPENRRALAQAALEEQDHLRWSAERIGELGGRASLLNPFWYAGAFALGAAAGAFGDRWNLAFIAETERQVEAHLDGHLARISPADRRTRAVVEAMRADEARHRASAIALGAAELPEPVKLGMRALAKVMTTIAQRI
ncbi:MAG: 2-polyprenyl-3-methyl-6-methoxy-1,4-benzoquinone monooxygenase [Betaproteobacteria bacterium]|nr:2-polyprenyl-3-methyl-6-methoxy-1,4-benzoquinone monooxygenase [Betaproteobacteria bacterium]